MRSSAIAARRAGLLVIASCSIVFAMTGAALAQSNQNTSPAAEKPEDEPPATASAVEDANTSAAIGAPDDSGDAATASAAESSTVLSEDIPINLRLRRLERQVQALKERAWRAKARVGMLKEAVLGGGVGANASIVHANKMGSSFRLVKLVYALDGTQIFARNDESGEIHDHKTIDILTGPVAPGSHTISVLAIYRGHGYGIFKYLNKYTFQVRSSHTFTSSEGRTTRIQVVAFERGGVTTPLEKRPAIDFKVSHTRGTR